MTTKEQEQEQQKAQEQTNMLPAITGNDAMMQTLLNVPVFEQMQRAATLFSKSGLVPKTFDNNPAACFVGLQLAAQLGVNPFMLFQKMYQIGGKIGIEAQVAISIANQKGVFDSAIEHTFEGAGKQRKCTASAKLARSGKVVSLTIDWETVEKEGWNKKPGSKWLTMPDQMFRYRTSSWLIKTYAPECLMGLHTREELEDSNIINITPNTPDIDDTNSALDAAYEASQQQKEEPKEEPKQQSQPEQEPEPESKADTDDKEDLADKIAQLRKAAGVEKDTIFTSVYKTLVGEKHAKTRISELPEDALESLIKGLQGMADRKASR